jgi:hypothetical protein
MKLDNFISSEHRLTPISPMPGWEGVSNKDPNVWVDGVRQPPKSVIALIDSTLFALVDFLLWNTPSVHCGFIDTYMLVNPSSGESYTRKLMEGFFRKGWGRIDEMFDEILYQKITQVSPSALFTLRSGGTLVLSSCPCLDVLPPEWRNFLFISRIRTNPNPIFL